MNIVKVMLKVGLNFVEVVFRIEVLFEVFSVIKLEVFLFIVGVGIVINEEVLFVVIEVGSDFIVMFVVFNLLLNVLEVC